QREEGWHRESGEGQASRTQKGRTAQGEEGGREEEDHQGPGVQDRRSGRKGEAGEDGGQEGPGESREEGPTHAEARTDTKGRRQGWPCRGEDRPIEKGQGRGEDQGCGEDQSREARSGGPTGQGAGPGERRGRRTQGEE